MKTPSSPAAIRIAKLFGRRLTTAWSDAEIREFRSLVNKGAFNDDLHDLFLIEQYYAFERRKGKDGIHRRDVLRLLRYWNGELDRAREWQSSRAKKPIVTIEKKETGLSDEQWQSVAKMTQTQLREFRENFLKRNACIPTQNA